MILQDQSILPTFICLVLAFVTYDYFQRKRKPKGSAAAVPEGSLLMFSTQMLNEASQEVLKKKKNATMVDYHQSNYGISAQQLRYE